MPHRCTSKGDHTHSPSDCIVEPTPLLLPSPPTPHLPHSPSLTSLPLPLTPDAALPLLPASSPTSSPPPPTPFNISSAFSSTIHDPSLPTPPPYVPLSSFTFPTPPGLYHPSFERDACGVGMIANLKGLGSHALVRDGLLILKRMSHRGACGCDEATGDGAGILTAIPHDYFARVVRQQLGKGLPDAGKYAVGNVFLPRDWDERQAVKAHVESMLPAHQLELICWRPVPVDNQQLGEGSRRSEPCIEQLFLTAPDGMAEEAYATLLFILRKKIATTWKQPFRLYICSLSPRVIVYKGQLTPEQLDSYFIDIGQWDFTSHLILVHSRFSTNTFPSWERAQPLRCIAHNGEINTLKGNTNWMLSRQGQMKSAKVHEDDWQSMLPIIDTDTSDSGAFDNVVELITHGGQFGVEEAMCMMIPEPWQKQSMELKEKREMYEYFSHKIEPWDGPALICFTDGKRLGASLDRNGLRPGRTYILDDDRVILASEVGVLPHIPDHLIRSKGRLTPGEMFLIDFTEQRVVSDEEIKRKLALSRPYGDWLRKQQIDIHAVTQAYKRQQAALKPSQHADHYAHHPQPVSRTTILERLKMFGYTVEVVSMLVGPMGTEAMEALGSMGNDQALPCLSSMPKLVWDYFQQMFAQVTNPPIDPIRESIVMTLSAPIGPEGNLLAAAESDAQRIYLDGPVLTYDQFFALTSLSFIPHDSHSPLHNLGGWKVKMLDMTWEKAEGPDGLEAAIRRLCDEAVAAISQHCKLIALTDRGANNLRLPVPSLLAVGAVHQHLVRKALRSQVGLVVEAGDVCEVHHHCLLLGFGVDAILPYMAYEACLQFQRDQPVARERRLPRDKLIANYQKSSHKGVLKVMAKMGISTLQSYKGAQIFEAVGVHKDVIALCFTGCASRIGGSSFHVFAGDMVRFHEHAFPVREESKQSLVNEHVLENPGEYHWRTGIHSEQHLNHPDAISKLQEAARLNSRQAYAQYVEISNEMAALCTLRGQFVLKKSRWPIPIDQVEPARSIVKRFATGAMSYGSISIEAHSTLALAMNRIGGQSNTGEGGEHISRYEPTADGQSTRSAIKQVASGRFGVTIHYLTNANEIQIKMAQGAKPGEGGELPGHKVVGEIAKTRNSTPGVGLISPPPHHDIYSIEDLAQLIFDLKNANPLARISVKLVSEVGVGVVASGVAKGKADHILISGHDGGTGASKWTGIKHAGLPWELGLAEAHQTLVLNGLRGRVVLQTDGQIKTGLDVVKAALFGAEEVSCASHAVRDMVELVVELTCVHSFPAIVCAFVRQALLRHRSPHRVGLHHDAQVSSCTGQSTPPHSPDCFLEPRTHRCVRLCCYGVTEHVSCGHRHAGSRAASQVQRHARARHQLLLPHGRGGARAHGHARLPQVRRHGRTRRDAGAQAAALTQDGAAGPQQDARARSTAELPLGADVRGEAGPPAQ